MARNDPYQKFNFRVEIDGVTVAGFQEVRITNSRTPAVAYRAGNDPPHVRSAGASPSCSETKPAGTCRALLCVGHCPSSTCHRASTPGGNDVAIEELEITSEGIEMQD
jgi:hypothetical protein